MSEKFKIACVQTEPKPDYETALSEIFSLSVEAVNEGAKFITLPEYCGGLKTENGLLKPPSSNENEHLVLNELKKSFLYVDIKNIVIPVAKFSQGDIYYLEMCNDKFHLGGSSLGQVLGQIGKNTPTIKNSKYFKKAFNKTQKLIKSKVITSGHDIGSGGLITSLLELCFPSNNIGLNIDLNVFSEIDSTAILFSEKLSINHKVFFVAASALLIVTTIYVFPGIFLKESNRSFLNSLGTKNTEIFIGTGGGNYVKSVYKEYLITLEDDVLFEEFNITYSPEDKEKTLVRENEDDSGPVSGFLKLEFDYMDNLLPRSIVSFYYSNNGSTWNQIGSDHTSGVVIDLIENDSFFEVGGWGDGQSPGDQYLSGFIKSVKIETNEYLSLIHISEPTRPY